MKRSNFHLPTTYRISIALFLLTLVSCKAIDNLTGSSSQANISANNQVIATQNFEPQPIRVEIDRLPKPYTTNTASQNPQVISIPEKPILNVPTGFKVNVFAANLDRPRWLALTPDGDVLLAESRNDRILSFSGIHPATGRGGMNASPPLSRGILALDILFEFFNCNTAAASNKIRSSPKNFLVVNL
jgi:glucose/arabinose dehydrogenase